LFLLDLRIYCDNVNRLAANLCQLLLGERIGRQLAVVADRGRHSTVASGLLGSHFLEHAALTLALLDGGSRGFNFYHNRRFFAATAGGSRVRLLIRSGSFSHLLVRGWVWGVLVFS
jgi:hypothetical protein